MTTTSAIAEMVSRAGFDSEYLAEFEAKHFYDGPTRGRRLTNFTVLLLLATVIATFGVLSDSTASVIGAMIVAPLMGPIMATAAAVVMGSAPRALRSLLLVVLGVTAVVLFSLVLTWLVPDVNISFSDNAEITSRIAPGLLALLTALASGAAGAFISSRREISDSMGGVAIAISLVPPLCVVGIALNQGEWRAAMGALTLFLTNFLAILLAGGVTFLMMGLGSVSVRSHERRLRRNSFILIVAATLLIAIPLAFTSAQVIRGRQESATTGEVLATWLGGTQYRTITVHVSEEQVAVVVEGSGQLGSLQALADQLAARLGRPVVVQMRAIPASVETSSSGAAP